MRRAEARSAWSGVLWPASRDRHSWPELDTDGIRCTTLVKFPVAISGGSRAKLDLLARRDTLNAAMQDPARKHVGGHLDRLARRNGSASRAASTQCPREAGAAGFEPLHPKSDLLNFIPLNRI